MQGFFVDFAKNPCTNIPVRQTRLIRGCTFPNFLVSFLKDLATPAPSQTGLVLKYRCRTSPSKRQIKFTVKSLK
jgi:hypothetical protein